MVLLLLEKSVLSRRTHVHTTRAIVPAAAAGALARWR
jgi:hypothetical protein